MIRTLRLAMVIAAFATAAMAVSCAQQPSKSAADAAAAAKAAADSAKTAAAVQRGQHLFLSYCAMCHGDGGAGDGEAAARFARDSVMVAKLNNSDRMDKLTPEELRKVIAEGGGKTHRSDLMPPWAMRLTPEQIDDLVQFVVQLRYMNPSVPSSTLAAYMAAPEGVPADGRVLFVHHCVACHGSEGKGDGPFAAKLLETANGDGVPRVHRRGQHLHLIGDARLGEQPLRRLDEEWPAGFIGDVARQRQRCVADGEVAYVVGCQPHDWSL